MGETGEIPLETATTSCEPTLCDTPGASPAAILASAVPHLTWLLSRLGPSWTAQVVEPGGRRVLWQSHPFLADGATTAWCAAVHSDKGSSDALLRLACWDETERDVADLLQHVAFSVERELHGMLPAGLDCDLWSGFRLRGAPMNTAFESLSQLWRRGTRLADVLQTALSTLLGVFGADDGALFLVEGETLRCAAERSPRGRLGSKLSDPALTRILTGARPHFSSRVEPDLEDPARPKRLGQGACLLVPLVASGHRLGVLLADYLRPVPPPSENDLQLVQDLVDHWALAIAHVLAFADRPGASEPELRLYEAALQDAPIGLAVVDGNSRSVRWTNRALHAFLEREDGLVGHRIEELLEGAPALARLAEEVLQSGIPRSCSDSDHLRLARGTRSFRFTLTPLPRPDGGRDLLAIGVEVTEDVQARKTAEAKARRTEADLEELQAVVDHMVEGLVICDRKGTLLLLNRSAAVLLGSNGRPCREHFRELASEVELRSLDGRVLPLEEWPFERLTRGESFRACDLELVRRGKDAAPGCILRCNGDSVLGPDGSGLLVLTLRDVTEERGAEAERQRLLAQVQRHASELEAILSSIADGFVLHGADGEILSLNPVAESLLGLGGDESAPLRERFLSLPLRTPDGSLLTRDETPVARALRGEVVHNFIMRLQRRSDGPSREIWLSSSAGPIRAASGQVLGVVSTFTDVTRLHDLQEQRDDILRMISHDLRTPLSAVSLQAQMLKRGPDKAETVLRRAESVITNAKRMDAMIQDLVDYARLESGQFSLNRRPVELPVFTLELKDRLSGVLDTDRLLLELPGSLPPLWADPARLERILVNLVSNALKYSPKERDVQIRAEAMGGQVLGSIVDQGQGIAPDDLPLLFDRFYRSKRDRKVEGLGLGLYITRLLVEAHGGWIGVESVLGQGSTFRFVIPISTTR